MFQGIIASKTKINLLVKLFLNPATKAYLRQLASEFQVSTNSVRMELNNLTRYNILLSEKDGRNIYYKANKKHPLFPELSSMVRKITGIDSLVKSVIQRLGNLEEVYLTGDYAEGMDTGIIDVVLIGNINKEQLDDVVLKTERYIGRKIRTLVLDEKDFRALSKRGSLRQTMELWKRRESDLSFDL